MICRIAASKVAFPDGSVCANHVVEIDVSVPCAVRPADNRVVRGRVTAHHPLVSETPRTMWWSRTLEVHEGFIKFKA